MSQPAVRSYRLNIVSNPPNTKSTPIAALQTEGLCAKIKLGYTVPLLTTKRPAVHSHIYAARIPGFVSWNLRKLVIGVFFEGMQGVGNAPRDLFKGDGL